MEAVVLNLVMDIRVLRVKELPWRISTRQVFLKLMVKWLPSSVFLMVFASALHFLKFIKLRVCFKLNGYSLVVSYLGHGGARTAEYLKNNLFKNLSSHPDFIRDTKTAIGMELCLY
jgi:hypothetical protein